MLLRVWSTLGSKWIRDSWVLQASQRRVSWDSRTTAREPNSDSLFMILSPTDAQLIRMISSDIKRFSTRWIQPTRDGSALRSCTLTSHARVSRIRMRFSILSRRLNTTITANSAGINSWLPSFLNKMFLMKIISKTLSVSLTFKGSGTSLCKISRLFWVIKHLLWTWITFSTRHFRGKWRSPIMISKRSWMNRIDDGSETENASCPNCWQLKSHWLSSLSQFWMICSPRLTLILK